MVGKWQTDNPQITVVIPVYNGANYLTEAIDSVLAQTYQDFEIIVVDDGSTDETWSIIEHYMRAHPGIIHGLCKHNGGSATALNTGIRAARAKYIAWLSHDDRFIAEKLEQQIKLLESNAEVRGVYSDYSLIDAEGNQIGIVYSGWYPKGQLLRHLLQAVLINGSTLLIEKRCLVEVGLFDETIRYANDALMWMHLGERYQLGFIPNALTEYRSHAQQATRVAYDLRPDMRLWLKKAIETFTPQQFFPELIDSPATASDIAAVYTYLGDTMVRHKFPLLTLRQYWRAWRAWPSRHNPALGRIRRIMLQLPKQAIRWLRGPQFVESAPLQRQSQLLKVDLDYYSNLVKDVRFSFEK